MENNVDENLIEATIRRVAAQKAAIEDGDDGAADEAPAPPSAAAREDHIEETIRRVAAQKAALAAAAPAAEAPAAEEDPIEATIRRVAAQKAALDAEASAPEAVPTPAPAAERAPAPEDDDPIEATIRRVAAQKAALEAEAVAPAPPAPAAAPTPPSAAPEEDPIEATIRRVAAQKAARETGVDDTSDAEPARPSLRHFAPPSHYEPGPPPPDSKWSPRLAPTAQDDAPPVFEPQPSVDAEALARIERKLDETIRTIVHIAARVDALAAQAGNTPASIDARRNTQRDDDWDDAPVIPRLSGMPPRPSVLRDPSPMTATAEQLQPEFDNRPLPQPLPPIHADPPRRGLDLLPRTYRVTVEDKRRGVDLVPLHRALLGMDGVKDMSLLSYNNGVAIVALDTVNDLDPDALGSCISRAMSREARVEVHNEHTMVVKLAED